MSQEKGVRCPGCNKKFHTELDQHQHAKKRGHKMLPRHDSREETMADIAVDAHIKRLCGEPLDDLEASLLGDW